MWRVHWLIWSLCAALLCSCATVRTLTEYRRGDPVFMSGTRLDVAAIAGDQLVLGRLQAKPPTWPWLDLPFSFVADLFFWVLPRTQTQPGAPGSSFQPRSTSRQEISNESVSNL
jgi:uncharacterized protein YceK